jgi:F0F1-type ATP synthase delta subunit
MSWNLIVQFLVLTTLISGAIIFALYLVLIKTVDGAKQRLDRDAEAARERERELNLKIKEADAELQRRQKELDIMERKMRQELEEKAAKQKDEMIQKARMEAEEIIVKAQNAKEGIRRDIEKNMEIKIVDYSSRVVNDVFSDTVKNALDKQLFVEFIEQLKSVDMSRLGPDIKSADVITASPLDQGSLNEIIKIFKEKASRDIKLNPKIDKDVVGGVILQFESLLLDGSLQNAFKVSANAIKTQVEKQYAL